MTDESQTIFFVRI